MIVDAALDWIDLGERRVAVRHRRATAGRPTFVFLPGYASDMMGMKAKAVDQLAADGDCGCLRFDYSGTGDSGADFGAGTLDRWLADALAAIDRIDGRLILVGSSMGGWLALLVAVRLAQRVAALVGVAAAPDFTEWGFGSGERAALARDGRIERPSADGEEPLVTHLAFWRSGAALRLLDAPIAVACPVRLLHGEHDEVVPLDVPLKLLSRLRSSDVQLTLLKGGDHRLSRAADLTALCRTLTLLVEEA